MQSDSRRLSICRWNYKAYDSLLQDLPSSHEREDKYEVWFWVDVVDAMDSVGTLPSTATNHLPPRIHPQAQPSYPHYFQTKSQLVVHKKQDYQMQLLIQTFVERERQYRQRCAALSPGIIPSSTWICDAYQGSSPKGSTVYLARLLYHRSQVKKSLKK